MIETINVGASYLTEYRVIRKVVCMSSTYVISLAPMGDEYVDTVANVKEDWSELPEEKPVKKLYAYSCDIDNEISLYSKELSGYSADAKELARAEEYDIIYGIAWPEEE